MSTRILVSRPQPIDYASMALKKYRPSAAFCLLVSDFVMILSLFCFAIWTKHIANHDLHLAFYLKVSPCVLVFVIALWAQGLYPSLLLHPAEEMRRTFHAVTAVIVVLLASTFFLRNAMEYSRYIITMLWLLLSPLLLLGRFITRQLLSRNLWWPTPAVVLGTGPAAQRIARSLNKSQRGLRITGVLLPDASASWHNDEPPVIGSMSDAPEISRQLSLGYAVLAMPDASHGEIQRVIQDHCRSFRHILIITDLLGICCLGIAAREAGAQVGLEIPQRLSFIVPKIVKRCMDVAVSAILLVLLLPVFLIISAAIRINSRGPILFGHLRYGKEGEPFHALKFRTMVADADCLLEKYLEQHPEQRMEWQVSHKLKNDPRITAVGRWLRRYSLDELPQLLNILLGHMSLVGPRPIVQSEIKRYATTYDLYTRVLPGLTGLWQVSGRNNTTYAERVAYDDYYVRNWSVWMDLYILARTFQAVLKADGAY